MALLRFPEVIDDGRLDWVLNLLNEAQGCHTVSLDWSKTKELSPAGYAILCCLNDFFVEQKNRVQHLHLPRKLTRFPVVRTMKNVNSFEALPEPSWYNYEDRYTVVRGNGTSFDVFFREYLEGKFAHLLGEELLYTCLMIANELMQNSVDHSSAERYYIYAGRWGAEFHLGVVDMGVTIPARLEQKYECPDDLEYLELAMMKGTGTRRVRTGGLGLYYFFEHCKQFEGKLTIMSRGAQIRRYFKTRRSQKNALKYPLRGTWCCARFALGETT